MTVWNWKYRQYRSDLYNICCAGLNYLSMFLLAETEDNFHFFGDEGNWFLRNGVLSSSLSNFQIKFLDKKFHFPIQPANSSKLLLSDGYSDSLMTHPYNSSCELLIVPLDERVKSFPSRSDFLCRSLICLFWSKTIKAVKIWLASSAHAKVVRPAIFRARLLEPLMERKRTTCMFLLKGKMLQVDIMTQQHIQKDQRGRCEIL